MFIPNCKIQLNGLRLTAEIQQFIEATMTKVQRQSPSDSYLELCFVTGETNINGFLSVKSKAGHFESHFLGHNAKTLMQTLKKDLLLQLKTWSQSRCRQPIVT